MKIMKIIMSLVLICGLFACQKDSGENPVFGPNEVYLYDNKPATMTATAHVATTLEMTVSPNDGSVKCRWLLDDVVISNQQNLEYTFTTPGTFTLRFEATRGETTVGKSLQLTVN